MPSYQIYKGFEAIKGKNTIEFRVEVHSLGFYVVKYADGEAVDQIPFNGVTKVNNYIEYQKDKLELHHWVIKDKGKFNILFNRKKLTYKVKIK